MGSGEADGENRYITIKVTTLPHLTILYAIRALRAAEAALANPILGDISIKVCLFLAVPLLGTQSLNLKDAKGMLVNISGGSDLTLYEVDEAAERVTRVCSSSKKISTC